MGWVIGSNNGFVITKGVTIKGHQLEAILKALLSLDE